MPKTVQAPDWARAQRILAEVDVLKAEGRWTKEEFERLTGELEDALGPNFGEGMEALALHAEPGWMART